MSARRLLPAALLGVALAGCGGTPVAYTSDRELGDRPGLFSGPKGAFVIRLADFAPEAREAAAPKPGDDPGEYEEFQRWKKDRAASEQSEFEDWREWREWRKRQRK
jgi:hypothetical protein